MMPSNFSVDEISRLFFSQVRRMSIEAARPDASHSHSVSVHDAVQVSVC